MTATHDHQSSPAWQTRRLRYGPSGQGKPRQIVRRGPRDWDRGHRIAAAWQAEQRAARPGRPRAPFDTATGTRIIAAAIARISPDDTAAALGWTVGELLAAEARLGLSVTVTIEVRP